MNKKSEMLSNAANFHVGENHFKCFTYSKNTSWVILSQTEFETESFLYYILNKTLISSHDV